MPNVLVESAVIGLLVIVSNILAFKSFDRSSALYVEPESIESLLQVFQVFFMKKQELKESARNNGGVYREEVEINVVAENYVSEYLSIAL